MSEQKFAVGSYVKGSVCGMFVVLGYRLIAGAEHVQLKVIDPETGRLHRGELALPESVLSSCAGPAWK